MWEKSIAKSELEGYVAGGQLISNRLVAGQPVIHLLSDVNPGAGFVSVEPTLEDVFFGAINLSNVETVAQ